MELNKELPRHKGLFTCLYCKQTVKRNKYAGIKAKSCGCVAHLLAWQEKRKKQKLNNFIIDKNVCKVELLNQKSVFTGFAIIDKEDYGLISSYKWMLTTNGYVYSSGLKQYLHRYLTGFDMTDHIDRNPKNNRRNNLRQCSNIQNIMNTGVSKNNKSGYKGVCFRKDTKKWKATIMFKRKTINIGCYKTKEEAAKAYNMKAFILHGEFAYLNKI